MIPSIAESQKESVNLLVKNKIHCQTRNIKALTVFGRRRNVIVWGKHCQRVTWDHRVSLYKHPPTNAPAAWVKKMFCRTDTDKPNCERKRVRTQMFTHTHTCTYTHTYTQTLSLLEVDLAVSRVSVIKALKYSGRDAHTHTITQPHWGKKASLSPLGSDWNSIYIFNKLSHPQMHTAALAISLKRTKIN